MAAIFDVVILTAAPAGYASEAGGAYVPLDNSREALLLSIELFMNRDEIRQIQLVVSDDEYEAVKDRHGLHLGFTGVKLTRGGAAWADQLKAASGAFSAEATHVIVHDAARPAVPFADIDAVQQAAQLHPAVALTSPVRTPLVRFDENHQPAEYLAGERVMHLLTPQAFVRDAFIAVASSGTDRPIDQMHFIKGSPLNIRIGSSADAPRIKAMLALLPKKRVDRLGAFEEAKW